MFNLKQYTDENYLPISDLTNFGKRFINETKKNHQNNHDLTIINNYLIEKIDDLFNHVKQENLDHQLPELSKNDILFIKSCNNLKLNYSIQDYLKNSLCSYETGRKSLSRLVQLALYNKSKIGKKFVYKPTNKLILLLNRGKTWI